MAGRQAKVITPARWRLSYCTFAGEEKQHVVA